MNPDHDHGIATSPSPDGPHAKGERCDLPIEGMTCASCASRIERRLSRQPGVASASVNFVTKTATLKYDPATTGPAAFVKAVDDLGYKAILPPTTHEHKEHGNASHEDHSAHMSVGGDEARRLLIKTIVGAVLSLPVVVVAMSHGTVEAFNVPWINWLQLGLTTPVLF